MELIAAPIRFRLGDTVITISAHSVLPELDVVLALQRHQSGDWGEVDEHDREKNESALRTGDRLVSVYKSVNEKKFYIITEWDRSTTTILLHKDD